MPLGLKNVRATYQRLVDKMFVDYLRDTMEVYIDDMHVKTFHADQHLDHLCQTFEVLQKYDMKLNPTKCSFGIAFDKFLGFMITQSGIEANPDQIKSIMNIPSPTCIWDIQHLASRVASLSRSSEKCHHFFITLH